MKLEARSRLEAKMPISMVRKYLSGFNRARYASFFNKYGSGKGTEKYRIYIPISGALAAAKPIEVPQPITDYLATVNMSVADYKVGLALLPDGKRQIKLGKVLSSRPELLKLFTNDPQRSASKSVPAWVVISRHPYDIVGMSFDRGWTSCMNAKSGNNKKYLLQDVKYGALVAYLIKADDRNINKPSARIAIRPYTKVPTSVKTAKEDSQHVALVGGPTYGQQNSQFKGIVTKFCAWFNSGLPSGDYRLLAQLYDDSINTVWIGSSEELTNIIKTSKHGSEKLYVLDSPSAGPEHFHLLMKDRSDYVRRSVVNHGSCPAEILEKLLESKRVNDRRMAANSDAATPAIIDKALLDPDKKVQQLAASNPNVTHEQQLRILDNPNGDIARAIFSAGPQIPIDVLKKGMNHADTKVRGDAFQSITDWGDSQEKMTPELFAFARTSQYASLQITALEWLEEEMSVDNMAVYKFSLDKFMDSTFPNVRREVMTVNNVPKGVVYRGLIDADVAVRMAALTEYNEFKPEALEPILTDLSKENVGARRYAFQFQEKLTREQILRGLKDPDKDVRYLATELCDAKRIKIPK